MRTPASKGGKGLSFLRRRAGPKPMVTAHEATAPAATGAMPGAAGVNEQGALEQGKCTGSASAAAASRVSASAATMARLNGGGGNGARLERKEATTQDLETNGKRKERATNGEALPELRIVTYNIHKGFSHFNRRMVVHELRERLRHVDADIVFLQEVVGVHERHASRFDNWPAEPQYEFLAKDIWNEFCYGRNRDHAYGHHGNAVLSRFPIVSYENQNVSAHVWEKRGLLHCEIEIPGHATPVHCICVHLALNEGGRNYQVGALIERLEREVPEGEPVIIAGDFNDWRNLAGHRLFDEAGLSEAFRDHRGKSARSFPSNFPLLRLDRIYTRGFRVEHTEVHHGAPWSRISDHAALSARLVRTC